MGEEKWPGKTSIITLCLFIAYGFPGCCRMAEMECGVTVHQECLELLFDVVETICGRHGNMKLSWK
jgi:hypothetical protein